MMGSQGAWVITSVLLASMAYCSPSEQVSGAQPTTAPTSAPVVGDATVFDHSGFDRVLRAAVVGERVDYGLIRREYLGALDGYLERVRSADPEALPRDDRLAFYINAYNAAMIRAVIGRYRPGYSPSDDGFSVFDEPLVRVGGRVMSLNDLEHKVIRPGFNDPRVHAALVCAAVSCPPILARAYTAADLDETLEENMRRFVNDPTRNEVDAGGRRLRLSSIFDWYADDFGGHGELAAYVSRYHGADTRGFKVSFIEYSWSLNEAGAVAE